MIGCLRERLDAYFPLSCTGTRDRRLANDSSIATVNPKKQRNIPTLLDLWEMFQVR